MTPNGNVETLKFSTELTKIPVEIDNEDYILQEATGGSANVYNNDLQRAGRLNHESHSVTTTGTAEINTRLLSSCLRKIKHVESQPDELEAVPIDVIKLWPERIQSTLIDKLKEISNVDDVVTEERDQLLKAFERDDSPIELTVIRDWVEKLVSLPNENYKDLWELVKPSEEENSKN